MSLKTDVEAQFNAIKEVDHGTITVGAGPPCTCLIPEGVETSAETATGRHQAHASIRIVALAKDLAGIPKPGERCVLDYAGETRTLAVDADSVQVIGGGATYNFTIGK